MNKHSYLALMGAIPLVSLVIVAFLLIGRATKTDVSEINLRPITRVVHDTVVITVKQPTVVIDSCKRTHCPELSAPVAKKPRAKTDSTTSLVLTDSIR